jgi:predicted Ser/Thr protein kinase
VTTDRPRDLISGDVFAGRYHVRRELGRGAYGVVYLARDAMTNRDVALKVLRPNRISLSSNRWREAAALRRLSTPGVARLLDEGHVNDVPYVVMEHIQGEPFPGPRDPRPWAELRPRAVQLLKVLALVHGEGLVHGDLKPSNVMITPQNLVLLDFGLATSATVSSYESGEGSKGTPVYMAPELFNDDPASPQSDLFAVGTMIFEALTGRPFFRETSLLTWVRKLALDGPPRLKSVLPDVPDEAARLVDALLQVERGDRPRSAGAALTLLDDASSAPELPWIDRRTSWLLPELEELFAGPEVAFHLKTGPARVLWERTLGEPSDVAAELEAWFDFGLVQLDGDKLKLSVRALEVLEAGMCPRPPRPADDLDPDVIELLAWLRSSEPVTTEGLARLSDMSLGRVDDVLDRLEDLRLVRSSDDGWCRVRDVDVFGHLAADWLEQARSRLLEQTHDPLRRFELALGTDDEHMVRRAGIVAAAARAAAGDDSGAHATFRTTVMRLRALRSERVRDVVVAWGRFVLRQASAAMIEEVLWVWGKHDGPLRELLEARRSVLLKQDDAARRTLDALGPFADPELEYGRLASIGLASSWYGDDLEQNNAAMRALAEQFPDDTRLAATVRMREGFVAYRDGDYGKAARLHLQAAAVAADVLARLKNVVNAVWALIDAFDFEVALELTERHLPEVRSLRHPHLELQFEAARRQATFRSGRDLTPSPDLLAAAIEVGFQPLVNAVVLQEAVASWRQGDLARACSVLRVTAGKWNADDANWPILPSVVMLAFLENESLTRPVREAIDVCPFPRLKAQMLGLASYLEADCDTAAAMRDEARDLVAPELHGMRLELFAIEEIETLRGNQQ